jgi:FAD:protein FMN transferase
MSIAEARRAWNAVRPAVKVCLHLGALLPLGGWPASASENATEPPLERFEYREVQMGMPVRLVLYAPDEEQAREAARAVFERIDGLEDVLSTFRPRSEISSLNAAAGGAPVIISEELFRMLAFATEVARLSDGAFDVTVGPLTELWRTPRRTGELPSTPDLDAAIELVGWQFLELDPERRTARLAREGMRLDVGGIAKGYILDQALSTLSAHGISHALIEAGGDIRVSGAPPGRRGWRIELPHREGEAQALSLSHAAISTSGDTEQYIELDGRRYSHIVDPRTGRGLTTRLMVTVVAEDALMSDALATAVSVLGPEDGPRFAERFGKVEVFLRVLH